MRKIKISPGEYYHIYNRGVGKQNIFFNKRDHVRFLLSIIYFQSLTTLNNPGLFVTNYIEHSVFNISEKVRQKTLAERTVELHSFCLMPNHFHLLLYEKEEGGIARYMQRILNAYTKYFNTKYQRSGHLFQGPYQAVHVADNRQLLHLSAYIHRNPREFKEWRGREKKYPWSSYQDYIERNRWDELLKCDLISEQFSSKEEYQDFVESSPTKEFTELETGLS